jgi:hypothetical protein
MTELGDIEVQKLTKRHIDDLVTVRFLVQMLSS